jgi:hypothetical protein
VRELIRILHRCKRGQLTRERGQCRRLRANTCGNHAKHVHADAWPAPKRAALEGRGPLDSEILAKC